jgi:hypothetical protein
MKTKAIILMAALAMPKLVFASATNKKCTLSPVEQEQVSEYYGSGFERAIALSADLSKGTKQLSVTLAPRSSNISGVNQVVTYDLVVGAPSASGIINIEIDKAGVSMSTNFGFSSSVWDAGNIHNQSVMYKLPNDRLAVAVLVCQ